VRGYCKSKPRRPAPVIGHPRPPPSGVGGEVRWHHDRPLVRTRRGGLCFGFWSCHRTMERIWTTDLGRHAGERVRLAGWLPQLPRLSGVSSLRRRDARGIAQIVLDDPALVARLEALYHEPVLCVEGLAVAEPQAPGGVEVHEPAIEVVSPAA